MNKLAKELVRIAEELSEDKRIVDTEAIARNNAEIDKEVKTEIHYFVLQFYNNREIDDFYTDLNKGRGKKYVKRFFRELSGSIRIIAPRHYTDEEIIEMMKDEAKRYVEMEHNPPSTIGHFM